MGFEQAAIVVILCGMLLAFACERWRVETVALVGLALGLISGVVPIGSVFQGFSSPAVITVVEILLVVSVLTRSRVIDDFARRLAASVSSESALLAVLCLSAATVSVFMNNIGALALMFPVALSLSHRLGVAPGRILMALSFSTLLGGMCSLTGTPANLAVNQWLMTQTGSGMGYFELAKVGLPLVLAGVLWLVLASPRLFARFGNDAGPADGPGLQQVQLAPRIVASASVVAGESILAIEQRAGIVIHDVLRDGKHVFARREAIRVQAGDNLLVEGSHDEIEALEELGLNRAKVLDADEMMIEGVVMPESLIVGSRVEDLVALSGDAVAVDGLVSRRGRVEGRFEDLQFSTGDVVSLSGRSEDIRTLAHDVGFLLLSPRRPGEPPLRRGFGVGLFTAGVLASALGLVPVEIAFGGVILALLLVGALDLRRALTEINWRIVILLACMIPLGIAVETTGAARILAGILVSGLPSEQPAFIIATVLLCGVAMTPFIDNVSTAVILSPIAGELSVRTGTPLEPLLIAVAISASIDFLTPIGHHNNAIVMGVGGYRFGEFARLGAPLTAICLVLAVVILTLMA
ncbi:SLC13 family permease [Erythrobacter sp. LQ02-29]|uniref:SLC13 family permease n=1 Tax=Erythrobacter sp. LQ02-29 TaxID=2920384 RepID=UPI001F4DD55D|nr:SLC13 family permease [Erythrobacter sp. LQ02-29]MCP9222359.1 SLC13 family permease [Erythrobacter sp. LQ02-29]